MQNSGVFGALSDQVLKLIYDHTKQGMQELQPVHPKLFKQKSTTKKFERIQSLAPFGPMPSKSEGAEYSFDQIQPGYSKDITPLEYGFGFQWTETAQEDDDYEVLASYSKWLGLSYNVLKETQSAAVFNNGFTTQTTADGVALFSTAHTLKRGGTAQNRLDTDADLSVGSLQELLADMMTNTKLESGQMMRPAKKLYLWCHPVKLGLAYRVCKTMGLPGSDFNDKNPIEAYGSVTPLAWEYLTSENAWGVVAQNSSAHGLMQIDRVKGKVSAKMTAWQNGNLIVTIRARQAWDAFDWRNVAGTDGE